jgi:hypothetical protein
VLIHTPLCPSVMGESGWLGYTIVCSIVARTGRGHSSERLCTKCKSIVLDCDDVVTWLTQGSCAMSKSWRRLNILIGNTSDSTELPHRLREGVHPTGAIISESGREYGKYGSLRQSGNQDTQATGPEKSCCTSTASRMSFTHPLRMHAMANAW